MYEASAPAASGHDRVLVFAREVATASPMAIIEWLSPIVCATSPYHLEVILYDSDGRRIGVAPQPCLRLGKSMTTSKRTVALRFETS